MPVDLPYVIPLAGTAALVVFYFAFRAWNEGIFHPVVTALSLTAAVAAAFFINLRGGPIFENMGLELTPWSLRALALFVGIGVLILLRKAGHDAFANASSGSLTSRLFAGPIGALLSLIPAALFITGLAAVLRHHATFEELRYIDTCSYHYSKGATTYPDTPYTVKLRDAIEDIPRATEILDPLDRYGPVAPRHLVGLALISRNYDLFLAVGRDKLALEIYAHPRVTVLLAEIPVTALLDKQEHRLLLTNESILETAAVPRLAEILDDIDVIAILQRTVGMP